MRIRRAPAARPIRRSTPPRPRPGAPCHAHTRPRSRSCTAPKRSSASGEREAAAAQLVEVLAAASELGAPWLQAEAEGLAGRARLALPTLAGAPADAVVEESNGGADPFGLTPRERQVIALVANGATNREIGATLYMAEKTASVHVSRILAKLDVRSRTEAAAVAHRLGLG